MKIIYGKDSCILQGASMTTEVVITYLGSPFLSHNHLEIIDILNQNQAKVRNGRSTSVIIHGNNQIHIGYKDAIDGEHELFKYTGHFKILTAKVNNESVTIETKNIDYWEKINSKWDNAGKWESYKGTYKRGLGSKSTNKHMKRLLKKALNIKKGKKIVPKGSKQIKSTKSTTRSY